MSIARLTKSASRGKIYSNMSQITSIEQQKKDKTRCSVYVDGTFYCGLKIEVAVKYRLKPGMPIEKSFLDGIQLDNEKLQATEKAMNHLSATLKTEKQMRDFLAGKGYTAAVIEYVLEKLKGYGYIDDFAYCKSYVNSVVGKGKNAIRSQLIRRGAASEAIDEALSAYSADEDELLSVARKYMRGKQFDHAGMQKTLRHLIARGYDYDEAKEAVSRLFEECGDAED